MFSDSVFEVGRRVSAHGGGVGGYDDGEGGDGAVALSVVGGVAGVEEVEGEGDVAAGSDTDGVVECGDDARSRVHGDA